MATPRQRLSQLAQQAASQIGFTLRRWWREKTEPAMLRVEVERRLVGAPPAIAVLNVTIPHPPLIQQPSLARTRSASRSRSAKHTTGRTVGTRRSVRSQKA